MTDLRYPIGKFTYEGPPTPEDTQELLQHIEQAPTRLRAAVKGLSEQQLDTPYRPEGWTVRQLAHHVPDSHLNAYVRFKLALTEGARFVGRVKALLVNRLLLSCGCICHRDLLAERLVGDRPVATFSMRVVVGISQNSPPSPPRCCRSLARPRHLVKSAYKAIDILRRTPNSRGDGRGHVEPRGW